MRRSLCSRVDCGKCFASYWKASSIMRRVKVLRSAWVVAAIISVPLCHCFCAEPTFSKGPTVRCLADCSAGKSMPGGVCTEYAGSYRQTHPQRKQAMFYKKGNAHSLTTTHAPHLQTAHMHHTCTKYSTPANPSLEPTHRYVYTNGITRM